MSKKPWSGRFSKELSRAAEKFSASIDVDKRLCEQEIKTDIAYAKALRDAKVINPAECNKIVAALKFILSGIRSGSIKLSEDMEDIHMNIESLLSKKLGDLGKKLHTGRSRNDLIVTDLRIYLKEKIISISAIINELQKALIDIAEKNIDLKIMGYTHLQQAQPILLAHHMMAYFEMFDRDKARLKEIFDRVDVMPLGSAALAGSGFPIDRKKLAKDLGFSRISNNSLDAVSDRDFVAEGIFAVSLIMLHLSRFCEEFVIWSSQEFGFITIGDEYTTGSSMMPQKKNPDIAELIRGKAGGIYGNLMSILTLLKGLPLSYNRDMQEDKKPLFESVDTVESSLTVFTGMLKTVKFNKSAISDAMLKGHAMATELADYLVKKGEPFRVAHYITGRIVAYCVKSGKSLGSLSLWELRKFSTKIKDDVYGKISLEESVRSKNVFGGTSPKQVALAIMNAKARLSERKNP